MRVNEGTLQEQLKVPENSIYHEIFERKKKKMKKYICNDCGHKSDAKYKAYEHLNASSEEDHIFQEGMDRECESFREVNEHKG